MKKPRWISFRVVFLAFVSLTALYIFWQIADETIIEPETQIDHLIFDKLHPYITPGLTRVMSALTLFGSYYFLIPASILLIVFFALRTRDKRSTWIMAIMVVTSPLILFLLKFIFRRNRPENPLVGEVEGFSFPSGHSFFSFSFFGLLASVIWNTSLHRWLRLTLCILFVLTACVTAFSRAYLRVHFASDVVAGFCLSLAWLCMWWWIATRLNKQ
jgi:undecaprenyl-diphosphatase